MATPTARRGTPPNASAPADRCAWFAGAKLYDDLRCVLVDCLTMHRCCCLPESAANMRAPAPLAVSSRAHVRALRRASAARSVCVAVSSAYQVLMCAANSMSACSSTGAPPSSRGAGGGATCSHPPSSCVQPAPSTAARGASVYCAWAAAAAATVSYRRALRAREALGKRRRLLGKRWYRPTKAASACARGGRRRRRPPQAPCRGARPRRRALCQRPAEQRSEGADTRESAAVGARSA